MRHRVCLICAKHRLYSLHSLLHWTVFRLFYLVGGRYFVFSPHKMLPKTRCAHARYIFSFHQIHVSLSLSSSLHFASRSQMSHSLRDVRIFTSGIVSIQMGRTKHPSTLPDNPRSTSRRRLNRVPTATTYDVGVVPTVDSTVRIMTPRNGYLKFGVVMVIHLDRNSASGIPYVRVKLYNGDYLVRPQNESRKRDRSIAPLLRDAYVHY